MRTIVLSVLFTLFSVAAMAATDDRSASPCAWACVAQGQQGAAAPDVIKVQATRSWRNADFGADGHAAFGMSPNGALRLAFVCFRSRGSVLFFSGSSLDQRSATDDQILLSIDGTVTRLKVVKRDRGFAAPLRKDSKVLDALRAGDYATVMDSRDITYGRVSLVGSSAAIRTAMSRCGLV
ncbi:hypothetical protein [Roseivivax sp. CAU 1753]